VRDLGLAIGIILLVLLLVVAAYLGVLLWLFWPRAVGPDADEMAEDPVLHIEIERAIPGGIYTRTGFEGGPMPAMANGTSEASRDWTLLPDQWQATLLATVRQVDDDEDVTWSRLFCSTTGVTFDGEKDVAVGDDVLRSHVRVAAHRIDDGRDDLPMLSITLTSDGEPITAIRGAADPDRSGDCPPAIAETFTTLTA
jgi:hypothetical protein